MKNIPDSALGQLYREHINLILKKDVDGLLAQYAEDGLLISSFEKTPKYFRGRKELEVHFQGILGIEGLDTEIAFWAETENPTTLMIVEAITMQTPDGEAKMRFADSWVLNDKGEIQIHFAGMTQYPDGSVAWFTMLQIISQLALTCKDQKTTEDWYCKNFGFRRARVAKLPDGNAIIFIKMADSSFYLELFAADQDSPVDDAINDGHTFPGFRHLAFKVDNIYETCQKLQDNGVVINRPPRDGYMAFINSPDGISIELLQQGDKLEPKEPWSSMENTGSW